MRRAIPVIAGTAGSLALLAGFHTAPVGTSLRAGPHLASTAAPSSEAAAGPPRTAATIRSSRRGAPGRATATSTTAPPPRSVDGPIVTTPYGDVQVRVVIRGSRLVDVEALTLPSAHARSRSISAQAGPILRHEALQAQSANIDLVSGASYTSEAYAQSLQGALDSSRG